MVFSSNMNQITDPKNQERMNARFMPTKMRLLIPDYPFA